MRFSCHGEEEDEEDGNTEYNIISQRDAPQLNKMAVLRLDNFSQKSSVLAELEISQNLVKIPLLFSPSLYTKCFWSPLVKR
ncbi:hypothetical protein AOLI_G00285740 [Acnodon oligacanthus]